MNLLEKTRKVNKLIQKAGGHRIDFDKIAGILSESIVCNVYIISKDGEILGFSLLDEFECELMLSEVISKRYFPDEYNEWLLNMRETTANFEQKDGKCVFVEKSHCIFTDKLVTVIPIISGEKRLGTILLSRFNNDFNDEDLILGEYGATVVGMEILSSQSEILEEEARKKASVQVALDSLSYSELEALEYVFEYLGNEEGHIVASSIAEEAGITRSVIVNAIRKLESAGVLKSRSLGMKGTYIRVLNDLLIKELFKIQER